MIKFLRNNPIIIGVGSNLLGNLVMFITTIYLTRTFSVDVYGQFRLIFAFVALSVIFLQLGRDNAIIYYGQQLSDAKERKELIRAEVLFGWVGLVIGSLLLYVFSPQMLVLLLGKNIDVNYFQLSLLMIPLWGGFNLLTASMRSQGMINQSFVLTNFTQRISRLPFFFVLSMLSVSFYSLALSMIVSQLFLLLLALKKVKLRYSLIDIKLLTGFFKRLFYSLQLGMNAIIFVLLSRIDILMLGKFLENKSVAIYDTVVLLSFVVTIPFVALIKSSEIFMRELVNEKQKLQQYKKNLRLSIHLSSIIALFMLLVPRDILSVFGVEYIAGYKALVIVTVGYLILCFLGVPIELLNMNGKGKLSTIILIMAVILNIGLNKWLIPVHGLEGAAIATMASLIVIKLLGLAVVKRNYLSLSLVQLKPTIVFVFFIICLVFGLQIELNNPVYNLLFAALIVIFYTVMIIIIYWLFRYDNFILKMR